MSLPPGRGPIPVPGIDATTDPELTKASGELAAWIEYLLHPESHDGPRTYRYKHPVNPGEIELPYRSPFCDEQPHEYQTVSVIEGYATDTGAFFRAAQAVAGINEKTIEQTYAKLTQGCFTWARRGRPTADSGDGRDEPDVSLRYPNLHPARTNWMEMRNTWQARESLSAHEYEYDFILYQLYTENCVYVVAEHLVRYRAIFKQAGEDIAKLMNALMDVFGRKHMPEEDAGHVSLDWLSIVVTGLVFATTTVITGGAAAATAAVALGTAVEMIGEAVKTAETKNETEKKYQLHNHHHLRDVAKQYLDEVNKVEREVAEAIEQLRDSLRLELDKLRDQRRYPVRPDSNTVSQWVPHYRDYL